MKSLVEILENVLLGNPSELEKNYLFEILIEVARIRVRYVSKSKYFSLEQNEISLDDIALESVSNLLSNNEDDYLEYLRKSYLTWEPKISSEDDARYFVSKILDRSIYQCIVKKYAEIDPLFSKILKEIKRVQNFNSNYKLFEKLGIEFLALNNGFDESKMNIIPQDELMVLPISTLPENNYIRGWIDEVFYSLKENTFYDLVLPTNSLALKIKIEINSIQKIDLGIIPDPEKMLVLKEGVFTSLTKIYERIRRLESKKKKYSKKTTAVLCGAIRDVAQDMLEGDEIKNYFDYMKAYDQELTVESYRTNYRAQFEYLIKLLKNEIAQYYLEA
ncbi:MAG: hypothetical protein N3A61_09270 [Ignavibacteria bacterium]|nr:hypothetical protein [Ignavibacteria bacterium]